ncbi:MAG: flagellar basal body-associated FliL family protein [Clostridia bacterium]|nr:flagellar basal body-associated FliL family protein [Clostridia bacterium]
MQGKGNFFVLLFIVAFLALALAMLAGYVFFVGNSPTTPADSHGTGTVVDKPEIDELDKTKLFEGKKIFNLKTMDSKQIAVAQVSIEIQSYKKVDGIKKPLEKVIAYDSEIKELITKYFLDMTLEEAKKSETIKKTSEHLKDKINELLLEDVKNKGNKIVYNVVFDEWLVQ